MQQIQLHHLLRLFFLSYMANRFNITNHRFKTDYSAFFVSTKNNLNYEMFLQKNIPLRDYSKEHNEFTFLIEHIIKTNTVQSIFKNMDFSDTNLVFLYANELIRDKTENVFDENYEISGDDYEKLKAFFIINLTFLEERWAFTIKRIDVVKYLEADELLPFEDLHRKMNGKRLTGSFGGSKSTMEKYFNLDV